MNKILIVNSKYELKYNYYIYENGKIYSEVTGKFLTTQTDKDGYEKVRLISADGKRHRYSVHRLVLENFSPVVGMDKLQVNHIDGNKSNNKLSNLEWVTSKENIHHAIENNLRAKVNGSAKLAEKEVIEIFKIFQKNPNYPYKELMKKFKVKEDSLYRIKYQKSWKNVIQKYLKESSTTISEESTPQAIGGGSGKVPNQEYDIVSTSMETQSSS